MARVALQNSIKKTEMLENRIKRLAFEAARAQKVTDTVTMKAEKLLEARERHQIAIEERNRAQEIRMIEEERLRIRHLSTKAQNVNRRDLSIDAMQVLKIVSTYPAVVIKVIRNRKITFSKRKEKGTRKG
jgi:hypothetical protein